MEILNYCYNLRWKWNKKPFKLKDLSDYQLKQINTLVTQNTGMWYGKPSSKWINATELVLRQRRKDRTSLANAKKVAKSTISLFITTSIRQTNKTLCTQK